VDIAARGACPGIRQAARRIAYLSGGSRAATDHFVAAFLEGMHAHGYVEGRDFEIDYRFADGHLERVSALAHDLVQAKPDLILASIIMLLGGAGAGWPLAARAQQATIP
jgi:ABC-type uncharacterized transport system substrate-binding protein